MSAKTEFDGQVPYEALGQSCSDIVAIGAGGIVSAAEAAGAPLSVPIPFQNRILLFEDIRVAGTTHIREINSVVEGLEIGADLRLEREPRNLADTWAIKVFAGESRIGYVPADCNKLLALLMDGGKAISARLTSIEKVGDWNKLHMEVGLDD